MKEKNFRKAADSSEEFTKRPAKLEPIRKSGKERHTLYDNDFDDEDDELLNLRPKESVYDYFDDAEQS
ncbi:MAG: hypothetical protein SOZ00_03580 [Tidjanibacter sp.]|nr:hypothetical protein [Tidjanibacter sp.]